MKKTYFKYLFSSIKHDFSRLLAIFLIVMLGVGFVVGLMSTTPDLQKTVNNYYSEINFTDIYIQSTLGFTDNDLIDIKANVSDIKSIELSYQMDEETILNDDEILLSRVITRDFENNNSSIDKLTLTEGRFPENNTECVLLDPYDNMTSYSLNDIISIPDPNDSSTYIDLTIVGKVTDGYYLAKQAISSTTMNGNLDAIIYVSEDFSSDYTYTMMKMTFNSSSSLDTFSTEYSSYIDEKVNKIENLSSTLINNRVEEISYDLLLNQVNESYPNLGINTIDRLKELMGTSGPISDYLNEAFNLIKDTINEQNPTWYVLTRDEIQSFYIFNVDSGKVDAIANIFPVFFFAIALLVSITSISRIVNKDRPMMGTLKSLGYSKFGIYFKYFFYGFVFSTLGAIVGSTLGIFVLPIIIWSVYLSLYNLPMLIFTYQYIPIIVFSAIMVCSIVLVVTIITFKSLKEHVSNLLMGKAPLPGKKILLEKIPWLWRKLPFNMKSLFRNVFRFKKNLIMMIIGVGGCSAILLTGFGIQDSLSVLQNNQFTTIIKYDLMLEMSSPNSEINPLEGYDNIKVYTYSASVLDDEDDIPVTIISGDSSLTNFVGFDEGIEFNEDSIIITKQIADLTNKRVNGFVNISLDDYDFETNLNITDITTNYINNYIYMGTNAFNEYFGDLNLIMNGYLGRLNNLTDEEIDHFIDELIANPEYSSLGISVTPTSTLAATYSDILDNLGIIVFILVLLSGALIAIVIYNLTDIIINERIKEIATLRVNGYLLREALYYIYKEIIFMSAIGILIGIGVGVLLHLYVISSIASVGLCFGTSIAWQSYLYSIGLAVLFITLTALVFYPKIKKISMTEALKSVD